MDIAGVKCVMVEKTLYITIDGDIDHHTAKFIREEIDKAIYYFVKHNFSFQTSISGRSYGLPLLFMDLLGQLMRQLPVPLRNIQLSTDQLFPLR